MPVIVKCARIIQGIHEEIQEALGDAKKFTEGASLIGRSLFQRGINFVRDMGPGGAELARQIEEVFRPAQTRFGEQNTVTHAALRGLSADERMIAAKIVDKALPRSAAGGNTKILAAADVMRKRLDMDLGAAQLIGVRRRAGDASMPVAGSGRAFPTVLNRDGRKLLELAYRDGKTNGRVAAFLERLVDEGRYPDVDTALDAMREYHGQRLRGTNHYFESVRFDFPPEFREWDPYVVLPPAFRKNAMFLEGARRWGLEFEGIRPMLGQISRHGRYGRKLADVAQQFVQANFGVAGLATPWHADVANRISAYETITKLSGIFSPILQIGQRYVNTIDAPISSVIRATRDLPPIANAWMKGADKIKDEIARSGAISGFNPITEMAAGDRAQFSKLTRTIMTPFVAAARGNEYTSALIASYAIQHDVEALARVLGRDSPLGKMSEMLRSGALDPQGALERRIARRGIDPKEALAKWAAGERITPDELQTVMQKAVEEEQFVLNVMTEPVWWQTQPWLRLMWKFKTFGIRQTEFMMEHVVKEAILGNVAPALKVIAAGAIMGEVYHLSKDLLAGKDKSVTSLVTQRDPSKLTAADLAARIAGNFRDQGGLGVLSDVTWGIEEYVWGPALGTARNAIELAGNVVQDPSQTGAAVRDVLDREVVLSRQVEGLLAQAGDRFSRSTARYRDYNRFQEAGRAFQDAGKAGTLGAKVKAEVLGALEGPPNYASTPRTLRFRYAARAITASDPDKATAYLESVFASQAKTPREVDELANNARASMRANAPLGRLNEADRREFLKLLSSEDRRAATTLRREWIADYERALRLATRQAKKNLRRSR